MQRIILSLFLVWLVSLPACTKNEGAAKTDAPDARIVVTTASYDRLLKESTKPIVLDFWASWCGPCRMMDPIFAQASAERPDIVFGKVNVDEEPKLAQKHNIQAIPTLLVIVDGKVVSLTDYGAFVELEEGIEGLIHVSEMSWTRKVRHPSKVVSAGEEVKAVVLDIKPDNRRISLGMKQVKPNPWDLIAEKYPVGTTIEGKIKNITDFGLFIGIDEGIDGLVHISDISWTKRIKHPSEVYKKGDVVQAIVLDIEKDNERFSLGIKQLQDDPWKTVAERYEVGKEITGTITNLTDFGIFVELEEGIEGLVHVSEISKEKIKTPVGKYNVGDVLTAKVMNINSDERRIGLSIKRLEMEDEQSLLSEYVSSMKPATSTFGEILRENLQEKLNEVEQQKSNSSED